MYIYMYMYVQVTVPRLHQVSSTQGPSRGIPGSFLEPFDYFCSLLSRNAYITPKFSQN